MGSAARRQTRHDERWRICLPLYVHKPDDTIGADLLRREQAKLGVVSNMMAHETPGAAFEASS